MQTWGLARAFGGRVREWPLVVDGRAGAVARRPRRARAPGDAAHEARSSSAIRTTRPARASRRRISTRSRAIAARHGAWVLSDEIYRGAERDGRETPSMWGRYERAIVTSGLSKAYGLPGLRIGWIVAPPALVASLWSYHDYTTIAPGALSDRLARRALEPARRAPPARADARDPQRELPGHRALARRARRALQLRAAGRRRDRLRPLPSRRSTRSTLVTRLREQKSVLIVPGRSLRHGRLPAHRLRRRDRLSARGARPAARSARGASAASPGRPPPHERRARSASWSASATSRGASRRCSRNAARSSPATTASARASSAIATRRHGRLLAPRGLDARPARGRHRARRAARRRHAASRRRRSSARCSRRARRRAPRARAGSSSSRRRRSTSRAASRRSSHVRAALAAGAHVVTANKGPVGVRVAHARAPRRGARAGGFCSRAR